MATDLERLIVTMEANLKSYEKQMKRANDIADGTANKIERRFNAMNKNVSGIGDKFLKGFAGGAITGAIAGIFSAGTITGITDTVHGLSELGDTADRIGVTAEELQKLRYAADLAGGSAEDLDTGFVKFTKNISDAGAKTGDLYKVLQLNGIALRDQSGNLRSSTDLFGAYADLIVRTKNPQDQLNLAVMAFGKAAGPQLLGLLRQGSEGIQELENRATAAGVVLGNDVVAQAGKLDDQLVLIRGNLNTAFEGFAVEVAPVVVGALQGISESLRDISYVIDQLKKGNISNALGGISFGQEAGALGDLGFKMRAGTAQATLNRSELNSFYDEVKGPQKSPLDAGTISGRVPQGAQTPNDFQREIESVTKQTDALKAETAAQATLNPLINDYGYALDKAKVTQELLTAAQEAGIKVTPELRAKIDTLATGYATADVDAKKLAESQAQIKQQFEEMRDFGKDALSGFIGDLEQGKTAGEALMDVLQKIGQKLEQITLDWLFGGGESGSTFGVIGKALGFADGGYTGPGGRNQPAGIVHRGEYVFPQSAVNKIGVGNLEALRQRGALPGYAAGGIVGMPRISVARPRAGSSGPQTIVVKLDGARGNLEIEDAARRGASAAIAQSRADLAASNKNLPAMMRRRQLTDQ